MFQKTASTLLIFVLAFALVACSTLSDLGAALPAATAPAAANTATELQNKLAVGILKLENSELAVTTAQANDLLLLWQGVKLLTSDKSSSALELSALYTQIQDILTAEQVQAIQQVSWTQTEISALVKAAGGAAGQAGATARKNTSSTAQSQEQMGGGPGGMGGGPGGNSDLALLSGMTAPSGGATQATATPVKAAASTTSSSLTAGLNAQLAGAVIDLLQKRAAA